MKYSRESLGNHAQDADKALALAGAMLHPSTITCLPAGARPAAQAGT